MVANRSIRNQFLTQLIIASSILLIIFSTMLYAYIKQSIYDELSQQLVKQARYIVQTFPDYEEGEKIDAKNLKNALQITAKVIPPPHRFYSSIEWRERESNGRYFIDLIYPYNFKSQTYLLVSKDITNVSSMLKKILRSIIIINLISLILIVLYAFGLSAMLLVPITRLTKKLSSLNENFLTTIDTKTLPEEFVPLGESINKLINRIQTFVKYQKELFIGAAHELKTPLNVMKLKNDVTLIKKREPEKYIEALQLSNKTILEMNQMISSILEIGRQEGAHFELPQTIDIIDFIRKKGEDFALLAKSENKTLKLDLQPKSVVGCIQTTLLNQIIQNFLQNAIKFTPKGKKIILKTRQYDENKIKIEVIDEGPGIDESIDLFAPFKRLGNAPGAGLGLFLAKSAADAMGAHISIKNRKDGKSGAVATLILTTTPQCELPIN
ncbi:HAMP domain-containing sensor histidine kinase [Hydrogenimonas thermophila]|uniref:sensor histidine kinase n=1 Tax=Hydrogenimonas thermophila TaxID=223786 RepID=UPI002937357C|nr:HAMP domain-containing sensor histidine kinase [Hydrogenimonas thermophila]WOE70410.1 HAMP domain-containing sensor histidine kinase [Hydrogenimonas thermophila]WOE72925.1 HAMP domain-containing sensor histidine kinase [Hydrogenimonas thermophila]